VRRLAARRVAEASARRVAPLSVRASDFDRSGRVPLLLTTTTLGVGLYGWALPTALGLDFADGPKATIGLYMLTVSSSFVVPYLATRTGPVTAGQANLAFYGGTRGAWHGLLLTATVIGDLNPEVRGRTWATSMLVGSTAELLAGYYFAGRRALSAGEARTIAVGGDYGMLLGFGAGFVGGLDDGAGDAPARRMAAVGVVGAGLGLTGGYLLGRARDNTWGDGEVMRMSMLVGAWNGLVVSVLADMENSTRVAPIAPMIGGTAGLLLGDLLVRHTDYSAGRSLLVDLGALSGALAGAGIAYLVSGEERAFGEDGRSDNPIWFASAVGALTGFGLSAWALAGQTDPAPRSAAGGGGVAVLPFVGPKGQKGLSLAGMF